MIRRLVCIVVMVFIAGTAFSQNAQRVIPVSSPLYDDLAALYSASWMIMPSRAKPYTAEQFSFYLESIPYNRLDSALQKVYERISRAIDPALPGKPVYREEGFAASASGSASVLAYRHDQLDGDVRSPGTYDWQFGYEERSPLFTLPIEAWAFDSLYADIEITIRQDYRTIDDSLSPAGKEAFLSDASWTNVSSNPVSYDIFFPFRSFLSAGGTHWSVQFGRDQLSWGNGRTGNFMISDFPDFFDMLRLSGYWNGFTFTSMYSVFDPNTAGGETYLALAAHRLEFSFFKKVTFSMSESLAFGAKSYPELISDLNPVMIFHSWFIAERANSLLTLELDAAVLPFLRVYGQGVVDEFVTPVEEAAGATQKVKAWGYMAGAEASLPLLGGLLFLRGEWALTDPYLYNRIAYPYFRSQRRVWSYADPAMDLYIVKPVGYEYGPDCIAGYVGLEYRSPLDITGGIEATFLARGEKRLTSPYTPQPGEETPTGTAEFQQIIHANAAWAPFDWLSLGLDGWLVSTRNEDHILDVNTVDSELAATVTLSW